MIQRALEKYSNMFIVLHMFKQTWRWNYHQILMNVSGYWSVVGKWRILKFNDIGGVIGTPPPTKVTVTRNRNEFEVDGRVQYLLKGRCGRKRSSTDNGSADTVMQVFARFPKKSLRLCSCGIGIEKSTVHWILRARNWKRYIPRFVHVWCHCWECTAAEGAHFEYVQVMDVWGIEHNRNCISVLFRCWEIMFQRVYISIWDAL